VSPSADLCRKLGISEPTFYAWKKKYAGMGIVEMRRVTQLEEVLRKVLRPAALGERACWMMATFNP